MEKTKNTIEQNLERIADALESLLKAVPELPTVQEMPEQPAKAAEPVAVNKTPAKRKTAAKKAVEPTTDFAMKQFDFSTPENVVEDLAEEVVDSIEEDYAVEQEREPVTIDELRSLAKAIALNKKGGKDVVFDVLRAHGVSTAKLCDIPVSNYRTIKDAFEAKLSSYIG